MYMRICAFVEDNLLKNGSHIKHMGKKLDKDETMTLMVRTLTIFVWLFLLCPALPGLVAHKFASQLSTVTLLSLRSVIAKSVPEMPKETRGESTAVVACANPKSDGKFTQRHCTNSKQLFKKQGKKRTSIPRSVMESGKYCQL